MIVAVADPVSPPVQRSPILGHLASSHAVLSFSSRNLDLIAAHLSPLGITIFISSGLGFGAFLVPTSTEYPSGLELEFVMKSTRLGPPMDRWLHRAASVGVAGADNFLAAASVDDKLWFRKVASVSVAGSDNSETAAASIEELRTWWPANPITIPQISEILHHQSIQCKNADGVSLECVELYRYVLGAPETENQEQKKTCNLKPWKTLAIEGFIRLLQQASIPVPS